MDISSSETEEYESSETPDENLNLNYSTKNSYSAFSPGELEAVKQKERQLGFRKQLNRKRPNFIYKLRVIADRFLNEPSSSILVITKMLNVPRTQKLNFFLHYKGKNLVLIYIFIDFIINCIVNCTIMAKLSKSNRTKCWNLFWFRSWNCCSIYI